MPKYRLANKPQGYVVNLRRPMDLVKIEGTPKDLDPMILGYGHGFTVFADAISAKKALEYSIKFFSTPGVDFDPPDYADAIILPLCAPNEVPQIEELPLLERIGENLVWIIFGWVLGLVVERLVQLVLGL